MRTFKEALASLPKERQERIKKGAEELILEAKLTHFTTALTSVTKHRNEDKPS